MKLKELRSQANQLEPIVQVGKAGITEAILEEMKVQLKKRKLIKIKLLKSAKTDNMKTIALNLATTLKATLVQQVGSTITLHKAR